MMPMARRHLSSGFSLDDAIPSLSSGLFITPSIAPVPEMTSTITPHGQPLTTPKSCGGSYSSLSVKRKRAHAQDARYSDSPLAHWGPAPPSNDDDPSESRYTLAGQIESPGGSPSQSTILDDPATPYGEFDYRRALGETRDFSFHTDSMIAAQMAMPTFPLTPSPVLVSSTEFEPLTPSAWSRIPLIGAIGGVVGKMWQFCTASGTRFEGFSAGGGKRYSFKDSDPCDDAHPGSNSRIPGQFPGMEADYGSESECGGEDFDNMPSQPAVKRRQISENFDEIKRNWIIVDEKVPKKSSPWPQTWPCRFHPRLYISKASTRFSRSTSTSQCNVLPGAVAKPVSGVDGANKPVCNTVITPYFSAPHCNGHAGISKFKLSASASQGRSKAKFDVTDIHASPHLDAEAKQLATKKMMEARDTDARINNFNARLKEMIRQGKEALGTTIEVDEADFGDGEGTWEDDDDE
ncbi:hypothetical protein CFO_g3899 [Ceratocystis platani]|uniref:Uncharacterized protein n=1 Tax=Ceratocystis fimbriata f. sp. platani TaxID=88771 RepID=A0A0F8B1Z4_CERFI|nr:hypothetical protein CFO_g3899 [Ceratocystis platani]